MSIRKITYFSFFLEKKEKKEGVFSIFADK